MRQGFKDRDAYQLRKWHNPLSNPSVQIWSYEDLEPEPEERAYWCAICKSKLVYLTASDTIWRCDNCMESFDTKIQDVPIKNTNEFRVTPWSELRHYPTAGAEDLPFLEAISLDRDEEENLETRTYKDRRIQHIHTKGSFADAIMAGALSANNKRMKQDYAEEGV